MDSNCLIGIGLVIAVLVSFVTRRTSRTDAEKYLRSVQEDLGQEPENPRTRERREAEERENYNRRAGAYQHAETESNSVYVDYDGWLRESGSNQAIQWVGNRATGATRRPN